MHMTINTKPMLFNINGRFIYCVFFPKYEKKNSLPC